MAWLMVIVLSGEMKLQMFSSERTCNNAGHRIATHWKMMHPPGKDEINIVWTCMKM